MPLLSEFYSAVHKTMWASPAFWKAYHRFSRKKPRRFHVFGVGLPKSGTHSIARLFGIRYRSDHEPRAPMTNVMLVRWIEGSLTDGAFADFLRARDVRLNLEMEANHPLHHCTPLLVDLFPEARFILTIRDCYSWPNSEINQQLELRDSFPWGRLQQLRYEAASTCLIRKMPGSLHMGFIQCPATKVLDPAH